MADGAGVPGLDSLAQLIREGGAIAVLIVMVYLVLREHLVPKGRLDDQKSLTKEAMDGWKAQTAATTQVAEAITQANKIDEERLRIERERRG